MRPRFGLRGPPPPQGMRSMSMPNRMRPPMRSCGGPGGSMGGMGPRPPPFPGMGPPPMMHFGPSPMGPMGPGAGNRGGRPMMPRMRPPPHIMPQIMRQRPMRPPNKKSANKSINDRKIKKKMLKFRSFYVTRPWVNDELRAQVSKKDSLFEKAKKTNKEEDWTAFKQQKDKCLQMYSVLKLQFIGDHPEQDVSKIMAEIKYNKKQANESKQDQKMVESQQSAGKQSQPAEADAKVKTVVDTIKEVEAVTAS